MSKIKIKKIVSVGLCMLLVGMISACGSTTSTKVTTSKQAQNKDNLTIVTSFYPMYIATLNVVRDVEGVEVVNMTPPITGCLHDYSVTAKDMKLLEDAQIFVINGAGMESFMDDVVSQMKHLQIIEAAKGIELLEEDHEHEEEEEEEEDEDHEETFNPHVWVSVTHAITQVQNIQNELSILDPTRSEAYEKNAQAYIQKLEELRANMHRELKDITQKDIVTFHEAFPYFAQEFDLNIVGIIDREPGSEPSAKELIETVEQIKTLGIKALFAEPQYPSKAAQTVAAETGAKVYILDPAATGPMEADAYIQIMNKNLEVLKEALK
ncbi:metal ABC transporter substrate-binding protein [Cellulosilyticum sp. I15G10I2]|uniref:metal ABC transporter substrate-binding protein n=1 Tax=Cellulosilyticum sp. I15G10I2 TaxID=1892843 RepID=UPI000A984AE3|nr:zinc ABC transporter substrate-binding protein [Cellulosilyticum sp. I15G10I2]